MKPKGKGKARTRDKGSMTRVSLTPLTVADADEMVDVLSGDDLYAFIGGSAPTLDGLRALYTRQVVGHSPDGQAEWHNWIIRRVADGQAVGHVQATITERGRKTRHRAAPDRVPWICRWFEERGFNREWLSEPDAGFGVGLTGIRMPRMNAIMERWVQSCRRERLDRCLIWNERHLRHALREYEKFYNKHRAHQALAQAAPLRTVPDPITDPKRIADLNIRRREPARRVLHEYSHAA